MSADVSLFEVLKFRLEKTYEIRKEVNIYLLAMLIIKPGLCTSFSAIRKRIRTLYAMHSHIHCACQPETARTRYHIQPVFNKATDVEHFTMFMKKILYTRCIHWQNTGLLEACGQTEFLYLLCKNEEKMWKSGNRYRFMCLLFGN